MNFILFPSKPSVGDTWCDTTPREIPLALFTVCKGKDISNNNALSTFHLPTSLFHFLRDGGCVVRDAACHVHRAAYQQGVIYIRSMSTFYVFTNGINLKLLNGIRAPYTVPIVQSGLASVLFEKKPCESMGIRCVKTSPVQMVSRW